MDDSTCIKLLISGRVQGVGFRYWVRERAEALGLDGWVRNLPDGRVEAVFAGPAALVEEAVAVCEQGPMHARVAAAERLSCEEQPAPGFHIRR